MTLRISDHLKIWLGNRVLCYENRAAVLIWLDGSLISTDLLRNIHDLLLVKASDCNVWEATCPILSPVISAMEPVFSAIACAIRIIYRRIMIVSSS